MLQIKKALTERFFYGMLHLHQPQDPDWNYSIFFAACNAAGMPDSSFPPAVAKNG